MKKITLSFITIFFLINAFSQGDYKKLPALGVQIFLNDFNTPVELSNGGLSAVLSSKNFSKIGNMNAGLAVSYLQGATNNIDFVATLSGSFVDYPVPGKQRSGIRFLLDATAAANIKLLSDKHLFTPYVTVGVGASKVGGYYGAFIPTGVGMQFNILDEAFILINSQYRIPVTENVAKHLYHSIGVAGSLKKRKAPEVAVLPPPPPPPAPVVEAPKDRDKDGILDESDRCPDVAGLAKYQGCPIPDTDKDGINDDNDKCVEVPGVARYQGCPVPDTDGDGINDEEDKCPTEKGLVENKGCPVLEDYAFNSENVQFITGSANLTTKAKAELDKGVAILNDHPGLKISINGYTDNVGKPASNLLLSQKRADVVKTYLISKGIATDRLSTNGFGIENPVADNKTAAGRTRNRRVEFKPNN